MWQCGSYSAASNNMKLVHRPWMGGLLHLVQLTHQRPIMYQYRPLLCGFNVPVKGLTPYADSTQPQNLREYTILGLFKQALMWQCGSYSAASNNMKLVHWPCTGLHYRTEQILFAKWINRNRKPYPKKFNGAFFNHLAWPIT